MSTWSDIIKHLTPEMITELEQVTLNSPILYAFMTRSYRTQEEPIQLLTAACVELSKHAKRMEERAVKAIELSKPCIPLKS